MYSLKERVKNKMSPHHPKESTPKFVEILVIFSLTYKETFKSCLSSRDYLLSLNTQSPLLPLTNNP